MSGDTRFYVCSYSDYIIKDLKPFLFGSNYRKVYSFRISPLSKTYKNYDDIIITCFITTCQYPFVGYDYEESVSFLI